MHMRICIHGVTGKRAQSSDCLIHTRCITRGIKSVCLTAKLVKIPVFQVISFLARSNSKPPNAHVAQAWAILERN